MITKERVIEFARMLLNDCDEDIPDEIIFGQRNGKYKKVQVNWFQGVVDVVETTVNYLSRQGKIVPTDLPKLVEYLTGSKFKSRERKTREDIDLENSGLKICLSVLEPQKGGGNDV